MEKMDNKGRSDEAGMKGPICSKLREIGEKGLLPFHMPGHKRKACGLFPQAHGMDITEITDCDDLHDPRGIIRESMDLLREIYGSRESWYLVNGSTAGVLAAMSAVCQPGDRILLARNCHKSVYNGIRLLRLKPVYFCPLPDPDYEIAGSIDPDQLGILLGRHPDIRAVILTSPTYEGVVSDIRGIREVMNQKLSREIPLIVDEAHGAHLQFHSYFPESAVSQGADLVVQSAHKTLASMTQTGLLHLCSDRISPDLVKDRLSIFQTSSPSYILMASAEYGVLTAYGNQEKVDRYAVRLENFRRQCRSLSRIQLVENDNDRFYNLDPGKLVFYAPGKGRDLFDRLREDYQIEAEMAQKSYIVCMTSLMDEADDYDRLFGAVKEIDDLYKKEIAEKPGKSVPDWPRDENETPDSCMIPDKNMIMNRKSPVIPERVYYSWECQEFAVERIPLAAGAGRIAARDIMIYPPGIPLITAGERFGKEIVEKLLYSLYNGYRAVGVEPYPLKPDKDPVIYVYQE